MKHRLYLIEGLPCSGKSTISAFTASVLEPSGKVCFVDEGTLNHPADYEFHAYAPAGLVSEEARIVSLSEYSDEMFSKLLPFKIYDFLPWEEEKPLMLDKWRQFVSESRPDTVYVFNCVFLQNPLCETMMRFNFPEDVTLAYIREIAKTIAPLQPAVIYLKNSHIAEAVRKASAEREGWLEQMIAYHVDGAYGKSIRAKGFDGYIRCLKDRQERELRILDSLSFDRLVLEDPQKDWFQAENTIRAFIEKEG